MWVVLGDPPDLSTFNYFFFNLYRQYVFLEKKMESKIRFHNVFMISLVDGGVWVVNEFFFSRRCYRRD